MESRSAGIKAAKPAFVSENCCPCPLTLQNFLCLSVISSNVIYKGAPQPLVRQTSTDVKIKAGNRFRQCFHPQNCGFIFPC